MSLISQEVKKTNNAKKIKVGKTRVNPCVVSLRLLCLSAPDLYQLWQGSGRVILLTKKGDVGFDREKKRPKETQPVLVVL
jgi:hypothetical protein